MDNIQVIPFFGTSFTTYVPILMIIIAFITLFDLLARILQLFGIESEESDIQPFSWFKSATDRGMSTELLEKFNTGKLIVTAEIRQLESQNEQLKRNRETSAQPRVSQTKDGFIPLHQVASSIEDGEEDVGGFERFRPNSGSAKSNRSQEPKVDDFSTSSFLSFGGNHKGNTMSRSSETVEDSRNKKKLTGKSGYSKLDAGSGKETKPSKDIFSFDDEESNASYGGRYTNF
jgi:hypothetical protein